MKNVVIVGGGTGTSVDIHALKGNNELNLSVIVTVFDSGGSAGYVLDEHGALPSSDAIQAIIALMPEESDVRQKNLETLRVMLSFRFDEEPPLSGRRLGNYMLVPVERKYGFDEAIDRLCLLYQTVGVVIPVATKRSTLVAHYANGMEVYGESEIDVPKLDWQKNTPITGIRIEPHVEINERAVKAILEADYILFGPGDLYTSILPNVVVGGFADAIRKCKAKLIYLVNIMPKLGQTDGYSASRHVETLESYLGKEVDIVIFPAGLEGIPHNVLAKYAHQGAYPVVDDMQFDPRVIRANLISTAIHTQSLSDQVPRSLVRHDPRLLEKVLKDILK